MDIVKKIGLTIAVIFLLGIIITFLFDNFGVVPGDGFPGIVLFGSAIIAIVYIWKSKKQS